MQKQIKSSFAQNLPQRINIRTENGPKNMYDEIHLILYKKTVDEFSFLFSNIFPLLKQCISLKIVQIYNLISNPPVTQHLPKPFVLYHPHQLFEYELILRHHCPQILHRLQIPLHSTHKFDLVK